MCYFRKKLNKDVEVKDILKENLDLICHFTLGNSRERKTFVLDIPQISEAPLWKFEGKKPKPMEIPHDFFLDH